MNFVFLGCFVKAWSFVKLKIVESVKINNYDEASLDDDDKSRFPFSYLAWYEVYFSGLVDNFVT